MAENTAIMETDELIVLRQLPVIEEQLHGIKAVIEDKVEKVLALECTESTVSATKTLRADLTKDFNSFEERRKLVKSKILAPYEAFDKIYKECITDVYKSADSILKKRIDEVDNKIKAEKREKLEIYFNEYLAGKGIDFVTLDNAGIKVNKSSSEKSLKEQAKAFIDRISDDLALIDTQEYKAEILVEYKRSLNVSAAITSVTERHRAIEAEKERAEQAEQFRQEQQKAIDKVNEAKAEAAPLSAPKTAEYDPVIMMRLGNTKIKAKKSDCVILKKLLTNGRYEIIV